MALDRFHTRGLVTTVLVSSQLFRARLYCGRRLCSASNMGFKLDGPQRVGAPSGARKAHCGLAGIKASFQTPSWSTLANSWGHYFCSRNVAYAIQAMTAAASKKRTSMIGLAIRSGARSTRPIIPNRMSSKKIRKTKIARAIPVKHKIFGISQPFGVVAVEVTVSAFNATR